MSEPMETGGVGKNPAIDKINRLNAAQNRANAVLEMERRVFQTEQAGAAEVLRKRRRLMEDFQISFKKKGGDADGDILRAGEHFVHCSGFDIQKEESHPYYCPVLADDNAGQTEALYKVKRADNYEVRICEELAESLLCRGAVGLKLCGV